MSSSLLGSKELQQWTETTTIAIAQQKAQQDRSCCSKPKKGLGARPPEAGQQTMIQPSANSVGDSSSRARLARPVQLLALYEPSGISTSLSAYLPSQPPTHPPTACLLLSLTLLTNANFVTSPSTSQKGESNPYRERERERESRESTLGTELGRILHCTTV
jgi:hypothetical protein